MYVTDVTRFLPIIQDPQLTAIGLDVEASGLDPLQDLLLLIQIATPSEAYVFNCGEVDRRLLKYALELIEARELVVIGHNLKYDLKMIYHNYGVLFKNVFDTQLAESLAYAGVGNHRYSSLDKLTRKYLGLSLGKDVRDSFIGKTDFDFTPEQLLYAEQDVRVLHRIRERQLSTLESQGQLKIWEQECRLEPVVAMMEYTGIAFNTTHWEALAREAERKAQESECDLLKLLEQNFDTIAGVYHNAYEACENLKIPLKPPEFKKAEREALKAIQIKDEIKARVIPLINFGSHVQALHVLQSLGVPTETTDKKELRMHLASHPIVAHILTYRGYDRKTSSFGEDFLKYVHPLDRCIHTSLNQDGAATGRFSSDKPNLQNIIKEKDYRRAFEARPGYLLATADYSNIELRIIGEVAREPKMIQAFNEDRDLHTYTASLIFQTPYEAVTKEQRAIAKGFNFAIIYGTTAKGLAYNFAWPLDQAKEFLRRYFENYANLEMFIHRFADECVRRGYAVTMLGRRRFFSVPQKIITDDDHRLLYKIKRQAVNHLPQGTSADMIKLALIFLFYNNPFGYENFRPLLTVHDEIVIEFKAEIEAQAVAFIKTCFQQAGEMFLKKIPVAFTVNVAPYWVKD